VHRTSAFARRINNIALHNTRAMTAWRLDAPLSKLDIGHAIYILVSVVETSRRSNNYDMYHASRDHNLVTVNLI